MALLTGARFRPADGAGKLSDLRSRYTATFAATLAARVTLCLFAAYAEAPEVEAEESHVVQVFADAATSADLQADVGGRARVTADLTAGISLAATTSGKASVTAGLTASIALASDLKGRAGTSAELTTTAGTAPVPQVVDGEATEDDPPEAYASWITVNPGSTNDTSLAAALRGQAGVAADLTTGVGLMALTIEFPDDDAIEVWQDDSYATRLTVSQVTGPALQASLYGKAGVTADLTTSVALMALTLDFPDDDPESEEGEESFVGFPFVQASSAADLVADLRGRAAVTASLTTGISIGAALRGHASLAADFGGGALLFTQLQVSGRVSASLTTGVAFAADLGGRAAVSGQVSAAVRLTSSLAGSARLAADLTTHPMGMGHWIVHPGAVRVVLVQGGRIVRPTGVRSVKVDT